MARVVLVTGVSRYLGERLALSLAEEPSVERVVGVDVVPPQNDLGRTEFVRADIRNPIIAKVIGSAEVDTVVHMSIVATPLSAGGRSSMKEHNVIGTMQLLAACQKAPSVRKFVVKSSTAVYGSSSGDPALFTEDMEPRSLPRSGYSKDVMEIEGYVRGFARRRPDVLVTTLRFANFIGPHIDTPFTRYFTMPVVPTVLGYDSRLQFVHEEDGLDVLWRAALTDHPGTFNVAGEGALLLSQAVRRAGRLLLPIPSPLVGLVAQVFRGVGLADFSPEQLRFLTHGRGVDCTRLRSIFGYMPRWSSEEAFGDFVQARGRGLMPSPEQLAGVERELMSALAARRG